MGEVLSQGLANKEFSESVSPELLNNEISGIQKIIAVISVYDKESADTFSKRLNEIISGVDGQTINYQDICKFVELLQDINEYMVLKGEDVETDYIVKVMEKYFSKVDENMKALSYDELKSDIETLEDIFGKLNDIDLNKMESLKRKLCELKAKFIIRAQEEDTQFDLHSFIKEDEESYFLTIIAEYANDLSNSNDSNKREIGDSIRECIVLDGNSGKGLDRVYDISIWKMLSGKGKNEILALNRNAHGEPTIIGNQPQESEILAIQPQKEMNIFQRFLRWLGFMPQTPNEQQIVDDQQTPDEQQAIGEQRAQPVQQEKDEQQIQDLKEILSSDFYKLSDISNEWLIEHIPKDMIVKWENERLIEERCLKGGGSHRWAEDDKIVNETFPKEGYTSDGIYLPRAEALLHWKMKKCEKRSKQGSLTSEWLNSDGEKIVAEFKPVWSDWYCSCYTLNEVDENGENNSFSQLLEYARIEELCKFIELITIIDECFNSNLVEQFHIKLENPDAYKDAYSVGKEIDKLQGLIRSRIRELTHYLSSDEVRVIIEVDEENRRLFYEEQNKEKLNTKRNDDDKQAGNSNVVTQPADSFKKYEEKREHIKLEDICKTLEHISIDKLAEYIPSEMVDLYARAQAIIDGSAISDKSLFDMQAIYRPEPKGLIYDMFDRQLSEESKLKQNKKSQSTIAIGNFGENGIVYLRTGDNENDIKVFLSGKDGNQKWNERSAVATDKFLTRVLYFSNFVDRIASSNTHEELIKDIVKRIKEKKPVTFEEMVKESKVFKALLIGHTTLYREYILMRKSYYRQDSAKRVDFYNKYMANRVNNREGSTFPEGESL